MSSFFENPFVRRVSLLIDMRIVILALYVAGADVLRIWMARYTLATRFSN
jgi:hypothetical protein